MDDFNTGDIIRVIKLGRDEENLAPYVTVGKDYPVIRQEGTTVIILTKETGSWILWKTSVELVSRAESGWDLP